MDVPNKPPEQTDFRNRKRPPFIGATGCRQSVADFSGRNFLSIKGLEGRGGAQWPSLDAVSL